jgi:DNA recombination-dependent growth factor C
VRSLEEVNAKRLLVRKLLDKLELDAPSNKDNSDVITKLTLLQGYFEALSWIADASIKDIVDIWIEEESIRSLLNRRTRN